MATKKTSTTSKKGPSSTPSAKANGAAKTKAVIKTSSKGTLAAKAAPVAKRTPTAKAPAAKSKAGKRPAAIVHWEIQSKQPEALHEFYGDVFGWEIDANNEFKYGMVSSKGDNGGIF